MCGEHLDAGSEQKPCPGSSPHVRGALLRLLIAATIGGIIPACAGSTALLTVDSSTSGDHPRMCGEHSLSKSIVMLKEGSSPHVRGALPACPPRSSLSGIIPACAGSTRDRRRWRTCPVDHPRMCGEHAYWRSAGIGPKGSSPHVRGAHFENSIIPRKRKDNWLFFIQFRFENFLAFRYLLALLHPFLGVPTKDPSFASLGRLINCNPSQSTGDQSAPYTLKAICCSFLAE